jgi:DNA polymerase elongation subunit (family B)
MREPLLIVDVTHKEHDKKHFATHIRAKTREGETVTLTVNDCRPKFWTAKHPAEHAPNLPSWCIVTETTMKSIKGERLWEVSVDVPSQIREVRDFFFPHYSADVPWRSLVRWLYGWTAVIEVDNSKFNRVVSSDKIRSSEVSVADFKLDLLYYDIETDDSIDMENTPERIVSIAIYDTKTGMHEVATTCPTSETMVKRFLGSAEALESVVEHTQPIPPLMMNKVWVKNLDYEDDDTNEAALLWWFKDRIKHYNPDVIAGQNILGYDHPYVVNRCDKMNREMTARYGAKPPVHHRFPDMHFIKRIPSFDTKVAYAEQVRGAAATTGAASLAWMAGETLGYGKVPRTAIKELKVNDPMMLCVYNVWDNVCASRVVDDLDLLGFYIAKTGYHNSTLHHSHSNMMLIEDMMGHLLMERSIALPSVEVTKASMEGAGIEQGGFVMEAPSGLWKNAFEVDNSMEYPSAIITGNFGPDTRVEPAESYPYPVTITPAGRVYRRDVESIMAGVLRNLAVARQELKRKMRDTKDKDEVIILDRQQRVMKENMNSWYGVLGSGRTEKTKNRPFRLADPGIGSDITEVARLHNDWNKHFIADKSLWFDETGVHNMPLEDGIELRFKTLYQDTDSCKVAIANHDEAEAAVRPFTKEDVESMANMLCLELNESFHDFTKETLNVPHNEFFEIKPDAYYARYFQWGVKKRYAYVDYDGKHGFRGVELRRSSTPPIVKHVQKVLFESILDGDTTQEVSSLIRSLNDDMLDPEKTSADMFGQPFGIKKTGTFAHKAAMWSNTNLGTEFGIGDKPCLYFAKKSGTGKLPSNRRVAVEWGDDPTDYGIEVDREMTIAKFFDESNSFTAILGAVGTSWKKSVRGVSTTSLDRWFS